MPHIDTPSPARPLLRRAGVFVLASVITLSACDRGQAGGSRGNDKGPRVIPLVTDTLHVPDSVRVATIHIDRTRAAEIEPAAVTARTGDVVRFMAVDGGSHAIAFDGDAMSGEARAFLEQTGQMRSPPFLTAGSTWVLSLKGAPEGRYPYRCPTHGVQGVITVTTR